MTSLEPQRIGLMLEIFFHISRFKRSSRSPDLRGRIWIAISHRTTNEATQPNRLSMTRGSPIQNVRTHFAGSRVGKLTPSLPVPGDPIARARRQGPPPQLRVAPSRGSARTCARVTQGRHRWVGCRDIPALPCSRGHPPGGSTLTAATRAHPSHSSVTGKAGVRSAR